MITDLTKEHPNKTLWRFLLPMLFSVMFQQIYNIADSMIAGRFAGENALAAVGASYPITIIFMAFAVGMNLGASVVVSRLFGAEDRGGVKRAVTTAFLSSMVLGIILTLFGYFFNHQMMKWIRTPQNIMADGILYLKIYVFGMVFLMLYNVCSGVFTALGDSKTPLYFLLGSSAGNIILDLIFVAQFHWGVAGVAWATFLCQGVSAILAVTVVIRRLIGIKTDGRFRFFDGSILKQILVVAIPSTLQQSFISIGNIIIQSVINDFGTSVIAGYSAAVKLNNLVITSLTTLGNGISNYTAQNIGAGKIDRIRSGFKASLKLVWLLCIPFALLYFTCGRWLLLLFLDNPTATAIKTGIVFLCILTPFYFIVSIKLMADGILRGAGIMNKFMISTFTDLILRVVLSIIFSKMFGSVGIWCSWPVGWCCGTAVSVLFYRGEQKRNFKNAFEA